MTEFTKISRDITEFKPRMKAVYVSQLADLRSIPFQKAGTTAQVKADGEFNLIHIDRERIYAINRFGRKTEDLPALKELHVQFLTNKALCQVEEVELLAELYAMEDYISTIPNLRGKPLPLPTFIHYLKGENKELQKKIHIGLFDLVYSKAFRYTDDIGTVVKGENFTPETRFKILEQYRTELCDVLEWIAPKSFAEIDEFWLEKVEMQGWEGLVIRVDGDTYKAKPNRDVDAVIIGINKNNKGYAKGLAKSVKVALMPTENSFVELGDATIPSEGEARMVYALTDVKVNETANTVFVKPLMVVAIDYISLFADTTNAVYKMFLGGFQEVGTMKAVRMKSPRVKGYRRDKHACTNDVGLNQIAE